MNDLCPSSDKSAAAGLMLLFSYKIHSSLPFLVSDFARLNLNSTSLDRTLQTDEQKIEMVKGKCELKFMGIYGLFMFSFLVMFEVGCCLDV